MMESYTRKETEEEERTRAELVKAWRSYEEELKDIEIRSEQLRTEMCEAEKEEELRQEVRLATKQKQLNLKHEEEIQTKNLLEVSHEESKMVRRIDDNSLDEMEQERRIAGALHESEEVVQHRDDEVRDLRLTKQCLCHHDKPSRKGLRNTIRRRIRRRRERPQGRRNDKQKSRASNRRRKCSHQVSTRPCYHGYNSSETDSGHSGSKSPYLGDTITLMVTNNSLCPTIGRVT